MNRKVIYTVAIALLSGTVLPLQAQSDSSVYNESVVVVGDYNPVLDGLTEKINVAPSSNDNIPQELQPKFNYSITPRRMTSLTTTSGIKAAKVLGSPSKIYNNYMRFGLGHDFAAFPDFNPMMDLYLTSTRHDNYSYGARFYHLTDITTFGKEGDSLPSPDYYGRNRESFTQMDVFGKYIFKKKHLFSASLTMDRMRTGYYGYSDSTLDANGLTRDSVSMSELASTYNNFALNLGAKSLHTDVNKLGYDANLGIADLWGKWNFSQFSSTLDASLHYGFPLFSKYKGVAYLHTNWQGYGQHDGDNSTVRRNLTTVTPYVDFLFNDFKFHVGLGLGFNGYDDPNETHHNMLPDITITKTMMNKSMSLMAGLQGGYLANDWNTLRLQNPYLMPAPTTAATVDNNLFAHLRINFSKKLILKLAVDHHFYKNFVSYKPKYASYICMYDPYYVDVNSLDLSGDFTFVNDEMISLSVGGTYGLNYNGPDNVILLYNPDFTGYVAAKVNYKDKWLFGLQTHFVSGVDADMAINPATNLNEVTKTLPAHLGISLDAEYLYSKALSFFAKVDNLTGHRYFLWVDYPAQRFNIMLGLTYTLPTKK